MDLEKCPYTRSSDSELGRGNEVNEEGREDLGVQLRF